jgi:hypothetical protein
MADIIEHSGWGGKREGAGRKPGALVHTNAWFKNLVRAETVDSLERLKQLRDQSEDLHVAFNATMALLAYGWGKPKDTIAVEAEVRTEYRSYNELALAIADRGISLDSILKLKQLDLEAERPKEE